MGNCCEPSEEMKENAKYIHQEYEKLLELWKSKRADCRLENSIRYRIVGKYIDSNYDAALKESFMTDVRFHHHEQYIKEAFELLYTLHSITSISIDECYYVTKKRKDFDKNYEFKHV